MIKHLKYFLLFLLFTFANALEKETYSISVCTTSTMENANICKIGILKTSKLEVFILQNENSKSFSTYLGKFNSYLEAKDVLVKSSHFINQQKPFVKKIDLSDKSLIKENPSDIKTPQVSEQKDIMQQIEEIGFEKFWKEMEKLDNTTSSKNETLSFQKIEKFDNLIINVDSKKNIMEFKGQNNKELINIKTYKVSTAKATIKKPLGEGYITSISLNPEWYPTLRTLRVFKEKGINLPSIVPFGHELNYMGAAKINLTHRVNGQEVYRIHGTLNENTIGTYESGGCIRMRNKDVFELATLLNQYVKLKNLSSIKVILQ